MKKWIGRIIAVVLVLAAVNDAGRLAIAVTNLDSASRAVMSAASQVVERDQSPNSGLAPAQKVAQQHGIELIAYEQGPRGVVAIVRVWVYGTWAVGPVYSLLTRQPLRTPFPMERTVRSTV